MGLYLPSAENDLELDPDKTRIAFSDPHGGAWNVQGLDRQGRVENRRMPVPDGEITVGLGGMGRGGLLETSPFVVAGSTERVGFVGAVGVSLADAESVFDAVSDDLPGAIASAESYWNNQLEAVFTPGNTEYSGHLPTLETTSDSLRKLYWWDALGVIYFRRDFAGNVRGRSYDTLMPNHWSTLTCIWDYSLSSLVHALLDPAEMRTQLEEWIAGDFLHTNFGTSSITGEPVANWYAVNDYAMTLMVNDFVRFNDQLEFLGTTIAPLVHDSQDVASRVVGWAEAWKALRRGGALADYNGIRSLLECVSSYTHEVASLNAANVWSMRVAADMQDAISRPDEALRLRREAERLLPHVAALYLPGAGYFVARQPDGSLMPIKHCYDFFTVANTIGGDLDADIRNEMVAFFQKELQTPNWMRALSPWDPDASFSVRPDHQWTGSYGAWPAEAARALVSLGADDVAIDWLDGLARSANQGPPSQAHFVAEAVEPINGGARKAPPQSPYINDWAAASGGAWVTFVLESVFGVHVTIDRAIAVDGSTIGKIDPEATLHGFRVGASNYTVRADGRIQRDLN